MARGVNSVQAQASDFDYFFVIEKHVVADVFEPWCIERSDSNFVARFAHGGHGLNMVPVAVGFEHSAHAERVAQLK